MQESTEEIPNFSLGLELSARKEPTSQSKTKENKTARFPNLSEHDLQDILVERHSKSTKRTTNWSVATFKGKHFLLLFYSCLIRKKKKTGVNLIKESTKQPYKRKFSVQIFQNTASRVHSFVPAAKSCHKALSPPHLVWRYISAKIRLSLSMLSSHFIFVTTLHKMNNIACRQKFQCRIVKL